MKQKCCYIFTSIVLSLAFLLSSAMRVSAEPVFVSDVPLPDYMDGFSFDDCPWFSQAVYYLYYAHVVDAVEIGEGGELFRPHLAITRGQFVTFLGKLAKTCDKKVDQESEWELTEEDCIKWAVKNHILYGREGGLATKDPLTRQEMAVFLIRFAYYMQIEMDEKNTEDDYAKFADLSSAANWAENSLKEAYCLKLMVGEKERDNTRYLHPRRIATRAEAAQAVMNYVYAANVHLPYYAGDVAD